MRNHEGYIDLCSILDIPNKNYIDTPDLFEELHTLLETKEGINILKYKSGTNLVFSFNAAGEIFYFNFDSRVDPYTNLVYEEVCHDLGIDAVSYDLAVIGNIYGNISKNYKKKDAHYISGYDVLLESEVHKSKGDDNVLAPSLFSDTDENIGIVLARYNTLESIWAALEIRYKDRKNRQEIVQKLMDKLVSIFIIDMLLGNLDRNYTNWEVVEYENGEVDLAPAYDGARSLMVHPYVTNLSMSVETRTEYFSDMRLDNNLMKYLSVSSSEYTSKLLGSTWVLSEENIRKILERIEEKTERRIFYEEKRDLIQKFIIHSNAINEFIEDNNEGINR